VGGATRGWAEGRQSSAEGMQSEETLARRDRRRELPLRYDVKEGGGVVLRGWDGEEEEEGGERAGGGKWTPRLCETAGRGQRRG